MFQWPKSRLWSRNLWLSHWFGLKMVSFERVLEVSTNEMYQSYSCHQNRCVSATLHVWTNYNCVLMEIAWNFVKFDVWPVSESSRNQVGIRSESSRNQVGIKSESGRNQTTQNDEFWTQNDKLRCTSHIHCTKIIVWVLNWASRPTTIALWLKLLEILSNLMFLPVSESSRNQVGISRNQNVSKTCYNYTRMLRIVSVGPPHFKMNLRAQLWAVKIELHDGSLKTGSKNGPPDSF